MSGWVSSSGQDKKSSLSNFNAHIGRLYQPPIRPKLSHMYRGRLLLKLAGVTLIHSEHSKTLDKHLS